jgi:Immunity protein 49
VPEKAISMNAKDKRLVHVNGHLEALVSTLEQKILHIELHTGSPKNCAMSLAAHALASAMVTWFEQHDLRGLRNWGYVGGKLIQWWLPLEKQINLGPLGVVLDFRLPLLSNNSSLIDWFACNDASFDLQRVEDPRTLDFLAYQALLALRGDWPRLLKRCEALAANPPKSSQLKKYAIDHEFYGALAIGNTAGMEGVLSELASPKIIRQRSNDESGFTQDLISSYAVIYAKIAWRHGYEVKVDSPYVPAEWLPNDPLDSYENHYAFLK